MLLRRGEEFGEDGADVEHGCLADLGLLLLQCPLAVNLLCLFSRAVELGIVAEDGIDGGADEGVVRRGDDGVYLEVVGIGNEVGGRFLFGLLSPTCSQQQG